LYGNNEKLKEENINFCETIRKDIQRGISEGVGLVKEVDIDWKILLYFIITTIL
jgi:hypothetical protein